MSHPHLESFDLLLRRAVQHITNWISQTLKERSQVKHAIKHKTSLARLTQLLQPSLAFCFSLQPMTVDRPVLDGTPSLAYKMLMRAATVVQHLWKSCRTCLCFIACFILLVIAPSVASGQSASARQGRRPANETQKRRTQPRGPAPQCLNRGGENIFSPAQ